MIVVWGTVLEHQGFMEVKQPSAGSRFELYFPESEGRVDCESPMLGNVETEGRGEHVLIIDDEESVRTLAEKLPIDLGNRVITVSSGEEAITFLNTQKADPLLDMLMEPGMNGYQTYKKITAFNLTPVNGK